MDSFEQFLISEGQAKFEEACKLHDVDSKNDPETEPYKSKYRAREIWQGLKIDIENYQNEGSEDERWSFALGALDLKLGTNYFETEEITTGETLLLKCEERLESLGLDRRVCAIRQSTLNQLGIVWAGRRDGPKALEYLQKAEKLYKDYKHEVGGAPQTLEELFQSSNEEDKDLAAQRQHENFEDTYTHTLYYLAQVYGKVDETKKSAEYCHVTLGRQLKTKKYNPVEWALNAATLSQYYTTNFQFPMARHCLASALLILQEAGEADLSQQPSEDEGQEEVDKRERIPRAKADVFRCWSKYGLLLMETSKDRLLEDLDVPGENGQGEHNADKKDKDNDGGEKTSEKKQQSKGDLEGEAVAAGDVGEVTDEKSTFHFDLELTFMEEQITDKYLLDFEDARAVFLVVQKWINSSKEFYGLDGHCSDYVEIVQDHSRLYKALAFFEPDFERQCKMQKRRVDMLSDVLKQLNPQFYLLICRQLIYEIAESYSHILDLKLAIIEEQGQPPALHALRKINLLAQNSIDRYHEYLDTLKSLKNSQKEFPSQFSDDDERPALVAFFCVGRLYSKFIEYEVTKRLAYMKKSVDSYKFIVDYCKVNPSAIERVRSERDLCEEMITLLPAKMDRIRSQAE